VKHTNEEAEVIDINNKMVMLRRRSKISSIHGSAEYPYFKRFTEKLVPDKAKDLVDDIV
jgi:hypothetical protein